MYAGETKTYLEHFYRLIYCRQDWDRATTFTADSIGTGLPHLLRTALGQGYHIYCRQDWDRATTFTADSIGAGLPRLLQTGLGQVYHVYCRQDWDRATTFRYTAKSTTHNTHFYSMPMACPLCSCTQYCRDPPTPPHPQLFRFSYNALLYLLYHKY
jgi:hypothetical protein